MAEIRLGIVSDIGLFWPMVERFFIASTEYGLDWTADDVKRSLDDGMAYLWVVADEKQIIGSFCTKVCIGRERYAVITDLAGDRFDEWIAAGDEKVTQWAKDMGCKFIHFYGRFGWGKKLAGIGYKVNRIEGIKHVE